MRSFSEYLADSLNRQNNKTLLVSMLQKQIQNGIEDYKKYLKEDKPKTVGWAEIENELVEALDKMENINANSK